MDEGAAKKHSSKVEDFRIKVLLQPEGRTVEIEGVRDVQGLLRKLGLRGGDVMVIDVGSSSLLTPDEGLFDGQEVEVRRVISGG
ncbi:MAG TPA: hypothetical protein EYP17_12240 [Candidatus Latescibacteria bacterium]|nr:hypothetical protein [Candidatus Latescibacterota bacterium]